MIKEEYTILLNKMSNIRTFINAADSYTYNIELVDGNFVVNGKSMMAIFAMDTNKPLKMIVHGKDHRDIVVFLANIKNFMVFDQPTTEDNNTEIEEQPETESTDMEEDTTTTD